MKKQKLIFLSASRDGYEVLKETLKIKEISVITIVTLGPGAKTKMYDGIGRKKWHEFNIPVHEIENINEETALIKSLKPDIIVMCGWRQIVNPEILNIPPKGFIAIHPTLLPLGRGPAPLINTILEGHKESGASMFYADNSLDGGDIIGQKKFIIGKNDYAADLYRKMTKAEKALIKIYLPLVAEGKASRVPQDEKKATYFQKRTMKDNEIDLSSPPEKIFRKIRAFSKPYNGAYIKLGEKKLIIWKAELREIAD